MLSYQDIGDKLSRPSTARVTFFLCAGLLAYELFADFFMYRQLSTPPSSVPLVLQKSGLGIVHNQPLIKKSLGVFLFGEYIPKDLTDFNLKPSGLQLSLVGILFSRNPRECQAIIAVANGVSRLFMVGDSVPGGASIKRITPDGVVLEHNGELESLGLPKDSLRFAPLPQPLQE